MFITDATYKIRFESKHHLQYKVLSVFLSPNATLNLARIHPNENRMASNRWSRHLAGKRFDSVVNCSIIVKADG
jgi:hypothetical protein